MTVSTVLGLPLYAAADTLPEALESLLTQTRRDFALVIADEGASDAAEAIVATYRALDSRISYHRNDERLGLTRNWLRVFEHAMQEHPEAEYFAWVSDHDVWHPRWLAAVVQALDANPRAAMAFPDVAILDDGGEIRLRPGTRDTRDVAGSRRTLDRLIRGGLRSGHMIYGLFRVDAVRRAGGFRHVLLADRLLLAETSLRGPFVRVAEPLWYRRITAPFSLARQRASCFPGRAPFYARLPWPIVHAAVLTWALAVRGAQRPAIGRLRGAGIALVYLSITWRSSLERAITRTRKRRSRRAKRGKVS